MLGFVTGIYPYSRNHSLAARRFGRGGITKEDLMKIKQEDSQKFVDKQKELGLDYISDGQFLWMDYARPFSVANLHGSEEELEMTRKSDTNTFIRRPKMGTDVKPADLKDFMIPIETENRSVKIYGPYTFANLSMINGASIRDLMSSYSKALAQSLIDVARSHSIKFVEITEPLLTEVIPSKDMIEHEKNCISIITNNLSTETHLSAPFNSMKNIWNDVLEFAVKGIIVDMRARDYFNIIPEAERIVNNHAFMFERDTDKTIVLGCVNGRNGGLTPEKGLETPEWIVNVVELIKNKKEFNSIGITFSTDEVIIPRSIADKKLENIAKAKQILGGNE